jgi:hypothetical protein
LTEAELRTRIRALLETGELPRVLPAAQKVTPAALSRIAQIQVGRVAGTPCLACGEPDPMVTYSHPEGRMVCLHAACDAIWEADAMTDGCRRSKR